MGEFSLAGTNIKFESSPDLFSPKNLDRGSELLLKCLVGSEFETALDWGCGWGAMALWMAKYRPDAKITAIDSDIAAIKAANINKESNGLANMNIIASHGFSELEADDHFDLIVSNPPTHRGRDVVDGMIAQSRTRLNPNGRLVLVVEARIKPWAARQMKEVFGDYKILQRGSKHVVLLAQN